MQDINKVNHTKVYTFINSAMATKVKPLVPGETLDRPCELRRLPKGSSN